jgi:hypothetical protein
MKPQNQPPVTGKRLVVAIEKLALLQLRDIKSGQRDTFDESIRRMASELGVSESDLISLFRKIHPRFPRATKREIEELVLSHLPQVESLSTQPQKPFWVASYLVDEYTKSGWNDVVLHKVRRSNIHTVLKTLDPIWQESVDDQVLQQPRDHVRANSSDLLSQEISNLQDFEVWSNQVLLHFSNVLIFKNFESSHRKPTGTIYAEQFRSYKGNWQSFVSNYALEIFETAKELMPEDLDDVGTRFYTQGKPSRADKLAMRFRQIMREEMPGMGMLEPKSPKESNWSSSHSASKGYKLSVSVERQKQLRAEKIWSERHALEIQSIKWLDSILFLWDQPSAKFSLCFESDDEEGKSKILFEATSASEALSKLTRLVARH